MKSINKNAPVTCSKSILINANATKIWDIITDIDQWHLWQTAITQPKLHGLLEPNTTFDWKTGGAKIHSTLHTVEYLKNFGWTGTTFGMYAIHNWSMTSTDEITVITVEESMEGFLALLFKKSFNKNLEKGMQTWLELLKTESEKNS